MSEVWFRRKHLPSFTLALSTLQEEPELLSTTSNNYLPSGQSLTDYSSNQLMQTVDHRSERYLEYPVPLLPEDLYDDGDYYDSDVETEIFYYNSSESVTVYEAHAPRPRFMLFRRIAWRLTGRCLECGEKLRPLGLGKSDRQEKNKKGWISSVFSGSSSDSESWRS